MRLFRVNLYQILIILCGFQFFAPVFGAGYTDEHDGTLDATKWTVVGTRTWSQSDGYAVPADNTNNYGFLINNCICSNNGTFIVTIYASDASTADKAGIVFRYSSSGAYCLIAANSKIFIGKITSISNLSNVENISEITTINVNTYISNEVKIKVVLKDSQFDIYSNDTKVDSVIDGTFSTGQVGYFHTGDYNTRIKIASSSWEDATTNYYWDVTAGTAGFQAGDGIWGTDNYWSIDGGTTLGAWGAGGAATFAASGTSKITVSDTQEASSLTFLNSGYTLTGGTLKLGNEGIIAVDFDKTATIESVISGTDKLKVTTPTTPNSESKRATLNLKGLNTYSGTTTIGNKTRLNVSYLNNGGVNSSIGASSSDAANLVIDGGQLRTTGDNDATTDRLFTLTENGGAIYCSGSKPINFTNTGAIAFNGSGARTLEFGGTGSTINSFAPVIGDGTGGKTSVKQSGGNVFILSGDNTYTGITNISVGTIAFTSIKNLGKAGDEASNLVLNGGTLLYTGDTALAINRLFSLGVGFVSGGTIDGSGNGSLWFTNTGTIGFSEADKSYTLTLDGTYDGNWLYSKIIDYNYNSSYPTSIVKKGTGRWTLTANNTATGNIKIEQGTLEIGIGGGDGSINGPVVNNGILRINRGGEISYSKGISGTGDLVKWGGGTLTLSGTNTYSGETWINTGTLKLGASDVIPDGASMGNVNVTGIYSGGAFEPATFDLANFSETVNGLNGSGNVTGSGTLTIGANNTNSNFAGTMSGSLNLTKTGTGIAILNGTNTFTGATTVAQGELRINGTSSNSAFTVYAGAKLSGNGTISGSVDIVGYGEVIPGNDDAGKLTTGSLTLNELSVLKFDLGTKSDTIAVTGNLRLDGVLDIQNTNSFGPGVYTLFAYTGTLTDGTLEIRNTPAGSYLYSLDLTENKKVKLVVVSIGDLLPVTVKETTSACSVYTDKWTLVFDSTRGGGISVLTDSCNGLDHGQGNQIGDLQNLFFVDYEGTSSRTNGTWSVIQKGKFLAIIRQSGTLTGNISYTNDYTIHGSGKMFVNSTITNNGGDVGPDNLYIGVERSNVATMSCVLDPPISAAQCQYLLLSSSGTSQNDILLCIKDLWNSSSVGIPNSVTSMFNNGNSAGYECNTFSLQSKQKQSWEFMVAFSRQDWSSQADVLPYVNDYRQHDSLVFVKGTVAMERDWEQHLYGHWKFDEVDGTTAIDESGNNYHATIYDSPERVEGKYGNALKFSGSSSQFVKYLDEPAFDGTSRFTVMAWIKPSALVSNAVIIEKHDETASGWKFGLNADGKLYLKLDNTQIDGTAVLPTNEWHHVAASYESGKVVLSVDGKYDKVENTAPNSVTANTANLNIGTLFNGVIDDVRFYDNMIYGSTLISIFRNGFRSTEGVYDVRANNNNTLDLFIDGGTVTRRLPIFRIANYWSTSVPAPGCVRLGNKILTENTDYYADLIDEWNLMYIGLRTIIVSDSVNLYIDDASTVDAVKRETPKMVSGEETINSIKHFWVKNFTKGSFDNADSKQWYLSWNMSSNNDNDGKDGDMSFFAASVADPNEVVSPNNQSNLTNHINPNSSSNKDSWGGYSFQINSDGAFPKTSEYVKDEFQYAVEESSAVRVKLRVKERNVYVDDTRRFKIVTGWSIYPTGQIFKWDSLYDFGGNPTEVYAGASMKKLVSSPTAYTNTNLLRGAIMFGGNYQDYAYAWLSMKNNTGYISTPFSNGKINLSLNESGRVTIDFCDNNLGNNGIWSQGKTPIQTVTYLDIRRPSMSQAYTDSVANSVQTPLIPSLIAGELDTTEGDYNADGFNEREGAYMIKKNNNNVHVTFSPTGGICSYQPAFVISNYTATTKPQYVIIYDPDNQSGTETNLYEGQYYNAYLNRVEKELVIQIDSVFCENVGIYISASQTLAVQMSGFWGNSGDNSDTLFWKTESEQDNLGFLVYRRVSPVFYDSLVTEMNKNPDADLSKIQSLKSADTLWEKITDKLIPGSQFGVSYGTKEYTHIDNGVVNGIVYEYKLESIDYDNSKETFGPIELKPIRRGPGAFLLRNNYPNPFKARTIIKFDLPEEMRITLNIYNLQGRLVKRLIRPDKRFLATTHQVFWDGKDDKGRILASGPYIYRLSSEKYVKSRMMIKLE